MINCLGTFSQGQTVRGPSTGGDHDDGDLRFTYHILLEYGQTDLKDVMTKNLPPVLPSEIESTWEDLLHVAHAVDKVHNLPTDGDRGDPAFYG